MAEPEPEPEPEPESEPEQPALAPQPSQLELLVKLSWQPGSQLPIQVMSSGIFRNPKIFPLMLTQGLRIEILLEEARKCVNQLVQASQFRLQRSATSFAHSR
eukprot:COSAG02_NODE_9911_length_2076_cov_24.310066_2_plen_102_part_00